MKPTTDLEALCREEAFLLAITEEIMLVMERDRVTQAELGRRLGISRKGVHLALRGDRNLGLRTLWRMADALGYEAVITLVSPAQNSTKTATRKYYLMVAGEPEREVDQKEYRAAALAAGFGELSCFSGYHGQIGRPSKKVEGRVVDE